MKTSIKEMNVDSNLNIRNAIFALILLISINILIINIKYGAIILLGIALLIFVLIKPKLVYFIMISLFAVDNYPIIEGATYAKIIGIILVLGLALRMFMTKESMPEDNTYKYIILFIAAGLVSLAFANNISTSAVTYGRYISLLVLYIVTRYFLTSYENINKGINYIFFATVLASAFAVATTTLGGSVRFTGGVGGANAYASYILVLIPLAMYKAIGSAGIYKIFYWGGLSFFLIMLVLTGSRGGVLGLLGAAGVLMFYYCRARIRQILVFIFIILIISYFYIPDELWFRISTITNPELEHGSSLKTRIENYKVALKMFMDYPLAGVGIHNFKDISSNYGLFGEMVIHNSYLEVLTGGGLLCFIPFILILISIWRKLKIKHIYHGSQRDLMICLKASYVSILITSFFITAEYKKILWFLLALISSTYYVAVNKKYDRHRKLL